MVPANCSHCQRTTQVETLQLINTALDPTLKSRVRDGSLFVWECPYCGTRNLLKYQTLYHDPDTKLMVWLLPDGHQPPREVEEAVKQLDGYTLRRVQEAGDLIEKVNIHDATLEDTVMEMCKWVTRRELSAKNPGILEAKMRFLRLEGPDNEIVMAFPLNGQMQVVNIGFNVYEDAHGILSRNPAVQPAPGFAVVDASWLEQFFR